MTIKQRTSAMPTTDAQVGTDALGVAVFTLTVDADGRVAIPGTVPGETVSVSLHPAEPQSRPLTPAEQQAAMQRILERGQRVRDAATPEEIERAINHGDWLYDEFGLPK